MSSSSGGFWPGEETGEEADEAPQGDEPAYHDVEETETGAVGAAGFAVTEPEPELEPEPETEPEPEPAAPVSEPALVSEPVSEQAPEPDLQPEPESEEDDFIGWTLPGSDPVPVIAHRPGEIDVPAGVAMIEGAPFGGGRSVGIVVARFNSEITNGLLESALEALSAAGVEQDRITVMPVPGAFELPIGAMALAKTRRYACIVALGAVVRGETPHFDYVAQECASGLQLAGIETGVPVSFGVLTVDNVEQAEARIYKAAEAVRSALEMADLFARLRASAQAER